MRMLFYLVLLSLFLDIIAPVAAASVNITVDDTFGNSEHTVIPAYVPNNDTWHAGSPAEQCDGCILQPSILDMSQILNQTWHHATFFDGVPIQIEVTFPGTAVYVYNVLSNTLPGGVSSHTNLSFSIDGETVGQFSHVSDSSSNFLYNQLVYSNTSLSNTTHTLVVNAGLGSLVIFDYLIYTIDTDTSGSLSSPSPTPSASAQTSHSSSHPVVAAIVGPVVGVVAVVLLAAAVEVFILRRKRRRLERPPDNSFSSVDVITPSRNTSFGRPVSLFPRSPKGASTSRVIPSAPLHLTEFN